jgi:RNA polymerase sigma-70 factor (ECF subfamily)
VNDDARSDAELLAATGRGDGSAFGVLVRRHVRAATLLAAQLLGDRDDAEDIVQDAFTVVLRDAAGFDSSRTFPPWLFAIIRRLASNRRARERRRERLLRLWGRDALSATATSLEDRGVLAHLDAEAAGRALADLSPMQRACFELVAVRGLSYEMVAAMHGIAESTARQHVFRARAALKRELTPTRNE